MSLRSILICAIALVCHASSSVAQPPDYPTTGLNPRGSFDQYQDNNFQTNQWPPPQDRSAQWSPPPQERSAEWSRPRQDYPDQQSPTTTQGWNEPAGAALPPPTDLDAPFFDPHKKDKNVWSQRPWEGSIEFGMNGSSGNAEAFSMKAGASLKRETKEFLWELDFSHFRATTRGISTQNNALGTLRAERKLGDSPWSLFAKGGIEYDEFKAFDYRVFGNGGLGFKLIDEDFLTAGIRIGSGVSREIGGPDDSYVPEAVFGFDYEHKLTERQKLVATIDYFPEWSEFSNYRLITDVGWEILLDEEHNLSLKVGVIDRYDSTPNGRKPNDLDYSLLLIWKL